MEVDADPGSGSELPCMRIHCTVYIYGIQYFDVWTVGDAVAAAGLGADELGFQLPTSQSVIDLPINTGNHAATEIRYNRLIPYSYSVGHGLGYLKIYYFSNLASKL